jgi:Bacterial SH3 domain
VKVHQIIAVRYLQIPLFVLWSFGCGIIPRSHDADLSPPRPASATAVSPGSTVEIKRTPGNFMLSDSSPVYEHPDKASAIIAYVPQGAHENVAAGAGDWLLIRLPDGKVGFIPSDAVKPK